MTLKQWDAEIAPTLRAIEQSAVGIQVRVKNIVSAVQALAQRPEWITNAECELVECDRLLTEAKKAINAARLKYAAKPTEGNRMEKVA